MTSIDTSSRTSGSEKETRELGRPLRIRIIGCGPAGLFLARLVLLADPSADVRLYERNGPDSQEGFGLVFSDRTMAMLHNADPQTAELISKASVTWSDVELRLPAKTLRYAGYNFTAISRRDLLDILRQQARSVGARMEFHNARTAGELLHRGDAPHVVAIADGVNSSSRRAFSDHFGSQVDTGRAKYIWFRTAARFDAMTFPFAVTEYGAFAAHAHPYGEGVSSFVVETDEQTWTAAGMAGFAAVPRQPGDRADEHSRRLLTEIFADHLGGRPLVSGPGSRWLNFQVVRNERWWNGRMVLLGDAAHTAHFSVGSGTSMAMADAAALAAALAHGRTTTEAFGAYERERRQAVARTQSFAEHSMRWWATFGRRLHLPPHQFGLHFITRTGAISYAGLRNRHADRLNEAEAELHTAGSGRAAVTSAPAAPFVLGPVVLRNRLVTRLSGDADEQRAQWGAHPATESALVFTDWRGTGDGPAAALAPWTATAEQSAGPGPVPGVLLNAADALGGRAADAWAAGVRVVQVLLEPDASTDDKVLDAVFGTSAAWDVAVCAGISRPAQGAWSAEVDALVSRCRALRARGVAAVHVYGGEPTGHDVEETLACADRIRTEADVPTLVDAPVAWRPDMSDGDGADGWSATLRVAVLSGRVDLIGVMGRAPSDDPMPTQPSESQWPGRCPRPS
ncbi:FAD-dependent monooxygenase [Streptomyces sp. NPDC050619]|uniref:FAD-dependent monooxygenase n=1 Tax=Streptomyces sp. NPDC050619 TaxID=3157214 RepID=UPI003422F746